MMNVFKRIIRIFAYFISTLALITLCLCIASSDHLEINIYNLTTSKDLNNDFTCLVVTDYHHRSLDFKNTNLIEAFKEEHKEGVDAIFYVGDLIDNHTSSLDDIHEMFKINQAYGVLQCYVNGNHEEYASLWPTLEYEMNAGEYNYIHDIDNKYYANGNIDIYGLKDPKFTNGLNVDNAETEDIYRKQLNKWNLDPSRFNILLVHRPMCFDLFSEYDFDLVIAGHVHGGQIKLGGLELKMNGYCSGLYQKNNSTMIVSRGLGYSALLPIRVNCNPEIVKIKISK